jgi:putative Holliday junction resolvase
VEIRQVSEAIPSKGRLGGIDFGTVRVGVAITDPDRVLASPHETYQRRTPALDESYFQQLAREERLEGWIIGLPLHMSGDESQKSQEAREFGAWLQTITQLPVAFFDERYSSSFASEALSHAGMSRKKKKKKIDQLAAQIILQGYLEWSRDRNARRDCESPPSDPAGSNPNALHDTDLRDVN